MAPPVQTLSVVAALSSGYQTGSSYTTQFTVPPSANRFLDTSIAMLSVPGSSVVSVTYKTIPLVFLRADVSVSGILRTEIWTLLAPPVGTDDLVVTLSTGLASVTGIRVTRGVYQSNPIFASNSNTGLSGPSSSITINAPDNGLVLDVLATAASNPTGNQPENWNTTGALGSGAGSMLGPISGAGGQSLAWSVGSNAWVESGFSLNAAIDEAVIGGLVTQTAFVTRQRVAGY